jgi:hypothetical protein
MRDKISRKLKRAQTRANSAQTRVKSVDTLETEFEISPAYSPLYARAHTYTHTHSLSHTQRERERERNTGPYPPTQPEVSHRQALQKKKNRVNSRSMSSAALGGGLMRAALPATLSLAGNRKGRLALCYTFFLK